MELILALLYSSALYMPRLIAAGLVLHAIDLILSAIKWGRLPLVGLHETLSFMAFAIAAVYLFFAWNRRRDPFTYITVGLILSFIAGAASFPGINSPLPPVLETVWFELHVILSFIAYALFAVGAVFGYLFIFLREKGAEVYQYRLLLLGYVLFSLGMIFGGIWAHLAWGSYWIWTPKELWTTIVWFWYSLYLHARLVRGWSGRTVAAMGMVGFFLVMFLYVGVGLLMKSSHEF